MDNISQVMLEATLPQEHGHVIHISPPDEPFHYKGRAFIRVLLVSRILTECQVLCQHLRKGTRIEVKAYSGHIWSYTVTGRETRPLGCL